MRLRLLAFVALASGSCAALADTYNVYIPFQGSGNYTNVGFTNNGSSLVLLDYNYNYEIFTPGQGLTTEALQPTLDNGNGPGTFTISAKSSGSSVGTLSILNNATGSSQDLFTGEFGGAIFNSFGDVAFFDVNDNRYGYSDVNFFYVNTTTHAAVAATTPEPSSIVLLASGLFGIAGVMRKRYVQFLLP